MATACSCNRCVVSCGVKNIYDITFDCRRLVGNFLSRGWQEWLAAKAESASLLINVRNDLENEESMEILSTRRPVGTEHTQRMKTSVGYETINFDAGQTKRIEVRKDEKIVICTARERESVIEPDRLFRETHFARTDLRETAG